MGLIRSFFYRFLAIDYNLHQIYQRQRILEIQLDFLMRNHKRTIRRKWFRMLTRRTSPFYIGDIYESR